MILIAGYLVWQPASIIFAVDTCLDQGGSFDYVAGACDFDRSHPYAPDARPYDANFLVAVLVGIVGAGLIAISGSAE